MNLTTEFPNCGHGCGQTESAAETSNFSDEKSAYSPQKQKKTRTKIGAELVGEGGFEPPKL
ncbi:MAG: hypothetical protein PUH34_03585 [Eubacteriales bacterium]|nr:hypothetical protein [Eubacteriales bacterium]